MKSVRSTRLKRFVLRLVVSLIVLGAILAVWAFWWEPSRLVGDFVQVKG